MKKKSVNSRKKRKVRKEKRWGKKQEINLYISMFVAFGNACESMHSRRKNVSPPSPLHGQASSEYAFSFHTTLRKIAI
jgi:hypothetical protein